MSSADVQQPPLALAIRGITAGYGGPPIVTDLDMDVAKGHVVAVVGPNGAGKSTLLKAILGIARVHAGRVELNGTDVTGLPLEKLARLGIGYVPQVDDVFDGLRVRENLDMGGYLFNRAERAERRERALAVFPQLRPRLNRYVETLSGGERKMTAIAGVLMVEQKAVAALGISDWAYMLVRGEVVMSADAIEVLAKPDMREIFLGAMAPKDASAERAQ